MLLLSHPTGAYIKIHPLLVEAADETLKTMRQTLDEDLTAIALLESCRQTCLPVLRDVSFN